MKYNYTVIIPFRDCTDMLRKACASIPVRNDIQIIVIDNAQNTIGADTIKEFGNPNILYLTSSPTKGAGCARNVGLEKAEGKYLLFLDADDYFSKEAFRVFDSQLNEGYDIVFFNATSVRLKDGKPAKRHINIDKLIKDYLYSRNEDGIRYHFTNPISKMIKTDLVKRNNIRFQEVKAGNDTMFSTWTGHNANRINVIDESVYVITMGEPNTTLTSTKNKENQFSRYKVVIDHYLFVKSIGRPDLSFRLISYLKNAVRFVGIREAYNYVKYSYGKGVNPFKL